MPRLDPKIEIFVHDTVRDMDKKRAAGGAAVKCENVYELVKNKFKAPLTRSQLRRLCREVDVDFDRLFNPSHHTSTPLSVLHTNLTALTERVVVLEEIVARMNVRLMNREDTDDK